MSNFGFFNTKNEIQFPLQSVDITGTVMDAYGEIVQTQIYYNDQQDNQEIFYIFPLNHESIITGFQATINGRVVKGVVEERKEAERKYAKAIRMGDSAMMLEEHRPNIYQISLGQVLKGESVTIHISYMIPIVRRENDFELILPMVVGPRYIPGNPRSNKTGPGTGQPTDQTPDADFITPPIGNTDYRASLNLKIETIGKLVSVQSSSHPIRTTLIDGHQIALSFANERAPLDSDLKISVKTAEEAGALGRVYRNEVGETFVYAAFMPDLENFINDESAIQPREFIFLLDVSGSMEGSKLKQTKRALRLCLRQLNEQDRFNLIAFESSFKSMNAQPVAFNQQSLDAADDWFWKQGTRGGTELLKPLIHILSNSAPDAVVVLFTDGEVGNDDEIIQYVQHHRQQRRFFTFGIDTAVNSYLLARLAEVSSGRFESVSPNEKIEDKVVRQFSQIQAFYLENPEIQWGNQVKAEFFPHRLNWVCHYEPMGVVARIEGEFNRELALTGRIREKDVCFVVAPEDITDGSPFVERLWAKKKLDDLENYAQTIRENRRADSYKEEIVELSKKYQILTRLTSFIAVYERQVKADGQPMEVTVPVELPAEWDAKPAYRQAAAPSPGMHYCLCNYTLNSQARMKSSPKLLKRFFGGADNDMLSFENADYPAPMDNASDLFSNRPSLGDSLHDFALNQRADGSFEFAPLDSLSSSLLALYILTGNFVSLYRRPIEKILEWILKPEIIAELKADPARTSLCRAIIEMLKMTGKFHRLSKKLEMTLAGGDFQDEDRIALPESMKQLVDRLGEKSIKDLIEKVSL